MLGFTESRTLELLEVEVERWKVRAEQLEVWVGEYRARAERAEAEIEQLKEQVGLLTRILELEFARRAHNKG